MTISEELRALLLARAPSEPSSTTGTQDVSYEPTGKTRDVFSKLRLRVDGQRPLRLVASEILTVKVGGSIDTGTNQVSKDDLGCKSATLLLTNDGTYLVHLIAEPAPEELARPIYRIDEVQSNLDFLAMVRKCQSDFPVPLPTPSDHLSANSSRHQKPGIEPQFEQLLRNLVPLVETPLT